MSKDADKRKKKKREAIDIEPIVAFFLVNLKFLLSVYSDETPEEYHHFHDQFLKCFPRVPTVEIELMVALENLKAGNDEAIRSLVSRADHQILSFYASRETFNPHEEPPKPEVKMRRRVKRIADQIAKINEKINEELFVALGCLVYRYLSHLQSDALSWDLNNHKLLTEKIRVVAKLYSYLIAINKSQTSFAGFEDYLAKHKEAISTHRSNPELKARYNSFMCCRLFRVESEGEKFADRCEQALAA